MTLTKITPDMLVPMDIFERDFPLRVDIAYAQADNLLFGERIYREDCRLWLHHDLAAIVALAARDIFAEYGYRMVLYDGLRSVDAQAAMMKTRRVRNNPHWLEAPDRLLSPPGAGAHPRAMAIDIALEDLDGRLIDMGCAFDFLAENPSAEHNPAHRDYNHPPEILNNRMILTNGMMRAATLMDLPLLPLPAEWWDFRMPPEVYDLYEPLHDHNLPYDMRMVEPVNESQMNHGDSGQYAEIYHSVVDRVAKA